MQDNLKESQRERLEAQTSYNELVFENVMSSKSSESLESQVRTLESQIEVLEEELHQAKLESSRANHQVSQLEESLEESQRDAHQKSQQITKLQERLSSMKKEHSRELKESQSAAEKAKQDTKRVKASLTESRKENKDFISQYIVSKSRSAGVNSSRILEAYKPGMGIDGVDRLIDEEIERSDRYRKLPTRNDDLISALSESTVRFKGMAPVKVDEEAQQAKAFMEQVYNINN